MGGKSFHFGCRWDTQRHDVSAPLSEHARMDCFNRTLKYAASHTSHHFSSCVRASSGTTKAMRSLMDSVLPISLGDTQTGRTRGNAAKWEPLAAGSTKRHIPRGLDTSDPPCVLSRSASLRGDDDSQTQCSITMSVHKYRHKQTRSLPCTYDTPPPSIVQSGSVRSSSHRCHLVTPPVCVSYVYCLSLSFGKNEKNRSWQLL